MHGRPALRRDVCTASHNDAFGLSDPTRCLTMARHTMHLTDIGATVAYWIVSVPFMPPAKCSGNVHRNV